jgi:hypothetical protein
MVRKIKSLCALLVLTFFSFASVAQDDLTVDESSKVSTQIDYEQLLSESAKKEITAIFARSGFAETINNGTLFDNIGVDGEVLSLSIPVTFTNEADYSKDFKVGEQHATSTPNSGGNIECWDRKAHTPHRGEEFLGLPKKPKAKAEGKCKYVHVYGTPPPWVQFDLKQKLTQYRISPDPIFGQDTVSLAWESVKTHTKQGLEVQWWPNAPNYTGTQVFGRCPWTGETDLYVHSFQINIVPAPGWSYTGPHPFVQSSASTNLISCP